MLAGKGSLLGWIFLGAEEEWLAIRSKSIPFAAALPPSRSSSFNETTSTMPIKTTAQDLARFRQAIDRKTAPVRHGS